MAKKHKVKLTGHFKERRAEDKGHDYDEADAQGLIDDHHQSGVQPDGLLWHWGPIREKMALLVTDVTASASAVVSWVVSMHRRDKLGAQHKPRND
jgi:hypothetical protein